MSDERPETGRFRLKEQSNLVAIVVGALLTTGAGGGVWASTSSLSSKVDEILKAQGRLELEVAKLQGAGTESKVSAIDERVRAIETTLAGLTASLKRDREERR